MRYAWLVIAVFGARFLVTAVAYPAVDGDLAWQRWLGAQILLRHAIPQSLGGETFTAAGAPWTPQEWLFSLGAAAGAHGVAWDLFASAIAASAVVTLALVGLRARRRGASARAVALVVACAGMALFESFGVRAQVLAWPFLALALLALESDGPWLYALIPLAAVWSNLHASAVLAPVLALAATCGAMLDEGGFGTRSRRLAPLVPATLLAICANPFGWHLPQYALALFSAPFKAFITEWKVTDVDDESFLFGALPLVLAAVGAGLWPSSRAAGTAWRDALLVAAFGWLMLGAARNVPLFAIAAAPLVASALTRRVPLFAPDDVPPGAPQPARYALPGLSLAMAAIVAIGLLRAQPAAVDQLAVSALAALEREPGEHRVLCADFAWCGLLVGLPRERVFLDGRADPYPLDVWRDFVAIVRLHAGWRGRLDARGVDAVVAMRDTPLDRALEAVGGWRPAYRDPRYRVWLRVARVEARPDAWKGKPPPVVACVPAGCASAF